MQMFQDTQTGEVWHFDDGVNPFDFIHTPATLTEVIVPQPSEAHFWQNGQWTLDTVKESQIAARQALRTADADAIVTAKADNVIQYLVTHTPTECAQYVQTNVTDLASAKTLLAKFAIALSVLAKQSLR